MFKRIFGLLALAALFLVATIAQVVHDGIEVGDLPHLFNHDWGRAAAVVVTAAISAISALAGVREFLRPEADRIGFLGSLSKAPHRPIGREREIKRLEAFRDDPGERRIYGLQGPKGQGASYLANWWATRICADWKHGRLLRRLGDWRPHGQLALILNAQTASKGQWSDLVDLLRMAGHFRLRVLIISSSTFEQTVADLPPDWRETLFRARFVPEPENGGDSNGWAFFRWRLPRRASRSGPRAPQIRSSTPEEPVFLRVAPLDDECLRKLARQMAPKRPRLTEAQLDTAIAASNGKPGRLGNAVRQLARDGRIDLPGDEEKEAEELIAAAVAALGPSEGLKVCILSAMGVVRPVSAEVRAALAPNAGDRLLLRRLFGDKSAAIDDEHVPPIGDPELAWALLLRSLDRLQAPDRRALAALVREKAPEALGICINEMLLERPERETAAALLVTGCRNLRVAAPESASPLAQERRNLARILAGLALSHWDSPVGKAWLRDSYARPVIAEAFPKLALALGGEDRAELLRRLKEFLWWDGASVELVARDPRWRRNRWASARLSAYLLGEEDPTIGADIPPDDPCRSEMEALALLEEAYKLALMASTEPQPPRLEDAQQARLAAAAVALVPLLDSQVAASRMIGAWTMDWLSGGQFLTTTIAPPDRALEAVLRLAVREDVEPVTWRYAAHAVANLDIPRVGGNVFMRWAAFADHEGASPRPVLPPMRPRFPQERMTPLLLRARGFLRDTSPQQRAAAVLLLLPYSDAPDVLKTAIELIVNENTVVPRQNAILIRLIQKGRDSVSAALADAFRDRRVVENRDRIFLGLLALNNARDLSDKDLVADPDWGDLYLSTRRAVAAKAPLTRQQDCPAKSGPPRRPLPAARASRVIDPDRIPRRL